MSYNSKYTGVEVENLLGKAGTALQEHQDISHLATKTELNKKQDTISDLSTIREGAAKGATAIQSHQDISGKLDKTEAASTYLSKTEASSTYLGKTAKAVDAAKADSATKAMQDGNGNLITDTYASKIAIVNHGTGDTTFALTPNVLHKWGEVANLSLTLAEPNDSTVYNEYMFEFISGSTATTLSLPDTIQWVSTPSVEANTTYQCSIVNNVGIIVSSYNL